MAKNVLRTALFSLFVLLYSACSVSPTYSRKDIESAIKNLCKQEFDIDVKVWEVGDTIWVYSPFTKMVTDKGEFDSEVSDKIQNIFLSLRRVILSMDKRPQFYCFVASDIVSGFDLYYVWNIQDLVHIETGYISRGDFQERGAFIHALNAQAIGDTQGVHISRYAITIGEFISYLVKQSIEKAFTSEEAKQNFQITDLRAKYTKGKIEISFDIMVKKYEEGLPSPFDVAIKSLKKFLKIYDYPPEITEIVITDSFNKKSRSYTVKALKEDK